MKKCIATAMILFSGLTAYADGTGKGQKDNLALDSVRDTALLGLAYALGIDHYRDFVGFYNALGEHFWERTELAEENELYLETQDFFRRHPNMSEAEYKALQRKLDGKTMGNLKLSKEMNARAAAKGVAAQQVDEWLMHSPFRSVRIAGQWVMAGPGTPKRLILRTAGIGLGVFTMADILSKVNEAFAGNQPGITSAVADGAQPSVSRAAQERQASELGTAAAVKPAD